MPLKVFRFVVVMLAALTLGLSFCHLMQLPARMAWDQYLWVGSTVQGGLYATFGTIGALINVLAVIGLLLLGYLVRNRSLTVFRLTAFAALAYAAGLILWWAEIYPVNVELAKWVDGPVPADWTEWRSRWEWGHALIAVLDLFGFGALAASLIAETPDPTRSVTASSSSASKG